MYRRTVDGKVLDFGVSGLLLFSNLVMYDRQTESWWQEFNGTAIVGDMTGKKLELLPMNLVSWKEFKASFPKGRVLSRETGHSRPYGRNPYTSYDSASSPFLYEGPDIDKRLHPMERVVAIDMDKDSLTVPYSVLEKEPVVHYTLAGQDLVIFFKKGTASALDSSSIREGRDVGTATVYDPVVDGRKLTFRVEGDQIVDEQTGTVWNLLGQGVSGSMAGKELRPIAHRAGQFWFSWVVFKPDTVVYKGKP